MCIGLRTRVYCASGAAPAADRAPILAFARYAVQLLDETSVICSPAMADKYDDSEEGERPVAGCGAPSADKEPRIVRQVWRGPVGTR